MGVGKCRVEGSLICILNCVVSSSPFVKSALEPRSTQAPSSPSRVSLQLIPCTSSAVHMQLTCKISELKLQGHKTVGSALAYIIE